jgi:GNAT superfamily N-acetyltransferase
VIHRDFGFAWKTTGVKGNASMDITIRTAMPADIPGMCDLLQDLFSIESDYSPDREKQVLGLVILLNDPGGSSLVVVAVRGGAVIGMGTVQLVVSTAQGGAVGLVEDIIVRQDHRGNGIGSRILSHLSEWSRMRGATRLQLLADANNARALDFYNNKGWSVTGLICLRKFI